MPYKFLSLEGLGRLGTRLKSVLTTRVTDESIIGQYTFQAKPLFNDDIQNIRTLFRGNLVFRNVVNNEMIGTSNLKDATPDLYFDINTAPAVEGFDFVSLERNEIEKCWELWYIPLSNPIVSSSSEMVSCINQGIVPNTKNLTQISFSSGLSNSITEIPRIYTKNATKIIFGSCQNVTFIPSVDTTTLRVSEKGSYVITFQRCENLEYPPFLNLSGLRHFSNLFYKCKKLKKCTSIRLFKCL